MQTIESHARGSVSSQHGRVWGFLMHRAINPVMRRLLASRFHRRIGSDMITVLSFQGRRTGRTYEFPIGYMQTDSEVVCYSPFGWWVNLQGGVPVTLTLRGQVVTGTADVVTDPVIIGPAFAAYLRHNPGDAFFFRVKLDKDREPLARDVDRAAHENVQIRIVLNREPMATGSSRRRR